MKKILAALICCALLINSNRTVSGQDLYINYINEIADMYGVAPELIQAMIYYESTYNPNAYSDKGAIGLMQVVLKYNRERMERLGVTDLYDPYSNILVGVDYLMELGEDMEVYEALTAYNCGPNSITYEKVKNGGTWEYADKILAYSAKLERKNNK